MNLEFLLITLFQ